MRRVRGGRRVPAAIAYRALHAISGVLFRALFREIARLAVESPGFRATHHRMERERRNQPTRQTLCDPLHRPGVRFVRPIRTKTADTAHTGTDFAMRARLHMVEA